MRGVCGTKVLLLGGSRVDQEVEGGSCPRGTSWSHARGSGVQGVLGQEAEVLPAGVVKGAGGVEARIEEGEQAGDNREDKRPASGSGAKMSGVGERGDEAPKKKQKVKVVIPPRPREKGAPRAVQDRDSGPDIVTALVAINNSMAALARAVMELNDYLWVISEYVDRLEWDRMPEDSLDEESEEWDSGDEEVVRRADKNIVK